MAIISQSSFKWPAQLAFSHVPHGNLLPLGLFVNMVAPGLAWAPSVYAKLNSTRDSQGETTTHLG